MERNRRSINQAGVPYWTNHAGHSMGNLQDYDRQNFRKENLLLERTEVLKKPMKNFPSL